MFLDRSKTTIGGRTYYRFLLRHSYRAHGRVRHRTIANLSRCTQAEIEAIGLALQHKGQLADLRRAAGAPLDLRQGPSVGAVGLWAGLARQIGLVQSLGTARPGKLALWQVIARVIDQGSRLSAVRLAAGLPLQVSALQAAVRSRLPQSWTPKILFLHRVPAGQQAPQSGALAQ